MRKHRVAVTAALIIAAGSLSSPLVAHAASGATTFHVNDGPGAACSDSTTNSATTPYCTIQAAVNVATSPGDTVIVSAGTYAPFTVTASGSSTDPITIESTTQDERTSSVTVVSTPNVATPVVTVSGASYVDLNGFTVTQQSGATAVDLSDATNVSLSSLGIQDSTVETAAATLSITDGSSFVSVLRSEVWSDSTTGAIVAQGGSHDVFTTNSLEQSWYGPSLVLNQTTDSSITSNSIVEGCGEEIDVTDGSTLALIQNNVLQPMQSAGNTCPVADSAAVGLLVDASSVSDTIENYNNVATGLGNDYSWNGTAYASAAALTAATGQGAHDAESQIDSANSDAPGELPIDIFGNARVDDPNVANTGAGTYSYYDRGATEAVDPIQVSTAANWPTTAGLSGTGTYTATVRGVWSTGFSGCVYDFGDGSATVSVPQTGGECTAQHAYDKAGAYTIVLTVVANDGYRYSSDYSVQTESSNKLNPVISVDPAGSRSVQIRNIGSSSWNILECDFDFGDGTPTAVASAASCGANHSYTTDGTFTITMTVKDSDGNVATSSGSFTASGYYYNPLTPVRVLDTRAPIGVPSVAKMAPGATIKLSLAGAHGLPASGATAVTLNVTATNVTAGGFVTVYPDGTALPNASNLNFEPGQTVPNTVVVKLGADGSIDLTNSSKGTIDLVADLEGYYAVGGNGFTPLEPDRVLDTRVSKTTLAPGATVQITFGTQGAAAVALNVTVVNPTAGGFVTAYPDGAALPNASNVNFGAKETVANEVIVGTGSDRIVDFTNSSPGSTDLVVDLTGTFTAYGGTAFTPIDPTRFLDTRNGTGVFEVDGVVKASALASYGSGDLLINNTGANDPVIRDATAVAANITVTDPADAGYVEAYPADAGRPTASLVNFAADQTIANASTMGLAVSGVGGMMLYNGSPGTVQLVVDVFGYYY